MTTKLKNKIDNKTGHFLCGGYGDMGCGCEISLGVIIRGTVFCNKCATRIKGVKPTGFSGQRARL